MSEIESIVINISAELQRLESLLAQENIERVRIQFPRGYLRKAQQFRNELFFLDDDVLKRNVAYHLLLTDLHRWLLNRFDVKLTAKEMLIKESMCLYGNICCAVVTQIVQRRGFQKSVTLLKRKEIIDGDLKRELEWLWGIRCKEHIENLKDWEYQKYTLTDHNRAVLTWRELKESLQRARQEGRI